MATWQGAAAGAIIGMLAARVLLDWYSWRSVFVISAGAALAAAVATLVLAPETKDEHPALPDVPGAVCIALGIGTLVFAIIEGNEQGWREPAVIAALTVTALASWCPRLLLQWLQQQVFDGEVLAHGAGPHPNTAAIVMLVPLLDEPVQLGQGVHLRDRDEVVAAEVADVSFDSALLLGACQTRAAVKAVQEAGLVEGDPPARSPVFPG